MKFQVFGRKKKPVTMCKWEQSVCIGNGMKKNGTNCKWEQSVQWNEVFGTKKPENKV